MYKFIIILAFVTAAFAGDDVLVFTDDDFAEKIEEHELVLVKFYAPWCGHCKKLAPEYEKAATTLKYGDPPVALAKVDCTAEGKDVCSKYDVKGFPTLKAFKGGDLAFEYNGPRDADGIVKYMRSKAGPSSKTINTIQEAEKFLASDEHSIMGFFSGESEEFKNFHRLADALNEDFRFAFTHSNEVAEKYNYKESVVIFRPERLSNKFEEKELKFEGKHRLSELKDWVNKNVHGLVGHRTTNNQEQFPKPLVVAYYDVDYVRNTKGTNYWRNRVMKIAKKLKDAGRKINFAISSHEDFRHELDEFGLTAPSDKPVVAAKDSKEQKFVMTEEFSMEALEKFAEDFLEDKLEPHLKSEPVPDNSENAVKVAVAKNFDSVVNDESKDVLIEFYAPWCGHCKNLAPKYEELAEKLAGEDEITIAKMDATANDVPSQYEVRGFPTIYFAPAGSKQKPKKYEGGREVEDFIKYLAKESTNPLKGFDRKGKEKKTEL